MNQLLMSFLVVSFALTGVASEALKGAKKDFQTVKTELTKKLEAAEKSLSDLKSQAADGKNEVKTKAVKEFEETRDRLRQEISELKEDSANNWQKIKKSLAESADTLNAKIQKTLKE